VVDRAAVGKCVSRVVQAAIQGAAVGSGARIGHQAGNRAESGVVEGARGVHRSGPCQVVVENAGIGLDVANPDATVDQAGPVADDVAGPGAVRGIGDAAAVVDVPVVGQVV